MYTVRGELVAPPGGCPAGVVLGLHGLSYGYWAWDFPYQPENYSLAQSLAGRGWSFVAIDELGYGESDHPNGYMLSVEAYADITAQIITQLRDGTYQSDAPVKFAHVGLMGHSAGAEITELTAGLHPELVDVAVPTAYEHTPTGVYPEWLAREWIPGDNVRAAQSDYEEFEQGYRSKDMYDLAHADPAVVDLDNSMANPTPSGEIWSIGIQPSRLVMARMTMPVLLVLARGDALFDPSGADAEMALFASSTDKTLHIVENAGHVFPLQQNAPETATFIGDWLSSRLAHC